MLYKEKYLKYKNKYLEYKKLNGGSSSIIDSKWHLIFTKIKNEIINASYIGPAYKSGIITDLENFFINVIQNLKPNNTSTLQKLDMKMSPLIKNIYDNFCTKISNIFLEFADNINDINSKYIEILIINDILHYLHVSPNTASLRETSSSAKDIAGHNKKTDMIKDIHRTQTENTNNNVLNIDTRSQEKHPSVEVIRGNSNEYKNLINCINYDDITENDYNIYHVTSNFIEIYNSTSDYKTETYNYDSNFKNIKIIFSTDTNTKPYLSSNNNSNFKFMCNESHHKKIELYYSCFNTEIEINAYNKIIESHIIDNNNIYNNITIINYTKDIPLFWLYTPIKFNIPRFYKIVNVFKNLRREYIPNQTLQLPTDIVDNRTVSIKDSNNNVIFYRYNSRIPESMDSSYTNTWWYQWIKEIPLCARGRLIDNNKAAWMNSIINALVLSPKIKNKIKNTDFFKGINNDNIINFTEYFHYEMSLDIILQSLFKYLLDYSIKADNTHSQFILPIAARVKGLSKHNNENYYLECKDTDDECDKTLSSKILYGQIYDQNYGLEVILDKIFNNNVFIFNKKKNIDILNGRNIVDNMSDIPIEENDQKKNNLNGVINFYKYIYCKIEDVDELYDFDTIQHHNESYLTKEYIIKGYDIIVIQPHSFSDGDSVYSFPDMENYSNLIYCRNKIKINNNHYSLESSLIAFIDLGNDDYSDENSNVYNIDNPYTVLAEACGFTCNDKKYIYDSHNILSEDDWHKKKIENYKTKANNFNGDSIHIHFNSLIYVNSDHTDHKGGGYKKELKEFLSLLNKIK